MNNTKFVEELITAYKEDNPQKIISLLETEINEAREKGYFNKVKRLKDVINKIPSKKTALSQSGSFQSKTPVTLPNSSLYEKINSSIILEDVVLDKPVKLMISNLLKEWQSYHELIKHNIYPINKLLLFGPPGTGKTTLAFALANKLQLPLILVRLDELISSYLGKTGKNIREIFEVAKNDDVIIFLDEIDTVAKQRDDNKELGELKRVVTVLLQNIDIFPQNSILIGATNNEKLLDKAIWRRFPLKIELQNPSEESRKHMFEMFLEGFPHTLDISLLAKLTEGFNGSAIYDVTQSIKKDAILRNKNNIEDIDAIKSLISLGSMNRNNISLPKKKFGSDHFFYFYTFKF